MTTRTDNQILVEEGYYWFSKQDDQWIPYQGPDGGEGWQRVGDDEVRYQQNPPGETADGVDEHYWADTLGADALTQFLDERVSDETMGRIGARVQEAEERMNSDRDTEAGYLWGRLQHRENRFNQDLSDAPEDKLLELVEHIFGRREKEFAQRQEMDELAMLVEDNADMGTRDKLNISEAVSEVQDDTDLTEEELRQDLYEMVQDADMPAEYVLDNAGLSAWKDSKKAEWRSENLTGEDAIKLPEGYDESDITTSHIYDAITATSLSGFQLPFHDYDPIPAVAQAMEDEFGDDPNKMFDEIEAFNKALEGVLKPFSQTDIRAPDHLNPKNAEEVGQLDEYLEKTGRSANSMFVAKGVPDEDGNKRDLFITNTNRNRDGAYAQDDQDAARQILGAEGFQAAGFPAPDSYHEQGEFWVVEGVDGDTADEFHVENDLENPVEQFAKLGATAAVLGAWDIHEGNVFINDGEFVPVDMDLAGAELHHKADHSRNRYGADLEGVMGLFPRMRRLFDRMDGGDSIDFDEIKEATKNEVARMAEMGEARKIAEAAIDSIDQRGLKNHIEGNLRAMEDHNFFETYPEESDTDTLDGFEEITDFSEGQVVEVTEDDREQRSQEFEITETYDDHVEVTALGDGDILGDGERWNINDPDEITRVFGEIQDPVDYDEFTDFDTEQRVEIRANGETIIGEIMGRRSHFMQIQDESGDFHRVEDMDNVVGVVSESDSEERVTDDEQEWEVRDPVGYDEFSDFDPGQAIQVDTLNGTRNVKVLGNGDDWLKVESMDGENIWPVSDVSDITGILEPASEEEQQDNESLTEDDVVSSLEDELDERLENNPDTDADSVEELEDADNDWEMAGDGVDEDANNPDDIEEVFEELSNIISEMREENND